MPESVVKQTKRHEVIRRTFKWYRKHNPQQIIFLILACMSVDLFVTAETGCNSNKGPCIKTRFSRKHPHITEDRQL